MPHNVRRCQDANQGSFLIDDTKSMTTVPGHEFGSFLHGHSRRNGEGIWRHEVLYRFGTNLAGGIGRVLQVLSTSVLCKGEKSPTLFFLQKVKGTNDTHQIARFRIDDGGAVKAQVQQPLDRLVDAVGRLQTNGVRGHAILDQALLGLRRSTDEDAFDGKGVNVSCRKKAAIRQGYCGNLVERGLHGAVVVGTMGRLWKQEERRG
mmetsp:Transcript_96229/g.269220  ORF Transcript_96229/g.269220 Transcript_96229/m.269220 type:complete len:205 (+) Transcript_96229:267-881(+)